MASWFGTTPKSFSNTRAWRLKELAKYAEFQINYTQTGRISSIEILEVKEPVYGALDLKAQFLKWLPFNIHDIAQNTEKWGIFYLGLLLSTTIVKRTILIMKAPIIYG